MVHTGLNVQYKLQWLVHDRDRVPDVASSWDAGQGLSLDHSVSDLVSIGPDAVMHGCPACSLFWHSII